VIYGVARYLWLTFQAGEAGNPTAILWKDRPLQLALLGWVVTAGALLTLA
jgi:hypothetical protein